MFNIYDKGFQITFENGYTISVQSTKDCAIAETTCWHEDNHAFILYEGDNIENYQSPKEVLELMNTLSKLPTPEKRRSEYDLREFT